MAAGDRNGLSATDAGNDPEVHLLREALERLAPNGVNVGCRRISTEHVSQLHAVELASVGSAIDARRAEFASGRLLLRELLDIDVAIPIRPNRAPELPLGVVGSLAHDSDFVVAAVSRHPDVVAVGIDIEPRTEVEEDEAAIIVRPGDNVADALTAFVQKEAAYKAWSSLGGRMLEHHDVALDGDADRFSARVEPEGHDLHGVHTIVDGRRVALVVVERHTNSHAHQQR